MLEKILVPPVSTLGLRNTFTLSLKGVLWFQCETCRQGYSPYATTSLVALRMPRAVDKLKIIFTLLSISQERLGISTWNFAGSFKKLLKLLSFFLKNLLIVNKKGNYTWCFENYSLVRQHVKVVHFEGQYLEK